jgi:hypothetical protein
MHTRPLVTELIAARKEVQSTPLDLCGPRRPLPVGPEARTTALAPDCRRERDGGEATVQCVDR